MIKVYKMTPALKEVGFWNHDLLKMGDKMIEISKEDLLKRFNRGYWRCGAI